MEHVGRRFSRPMQGDPDGLFMANYEVAARHLARRLRCDLLVELCSGIGGTTVCLAETCDCVLAIERDPARVEHARANLVARGLTDRVQLICGDVLDEALLAGLPRPDAVFADPEWEPAGRPLDDHARDIGETQPPIPELVARVRRHLTGEIALRVPMVADLARLEELGPCEIEAVAIDGQRKFFYVYYGRLARLAGRTEVRLRNLRRTARSPG